MKTPLLPLFFALACSTPAAAAAPASAAPTRREALERFSVMISSQIARRDTGYAVFHGCVDWHSAAHGHWALLRLARTERVGEVRARAADADLTDKGLAEELTLLRENPAFELPYGRSWLLRLAIEDDLYRSERGLPRSEPLRALADLAARSLLSFYQEYSPTPFSSEYENASWALVQMHDYFAHTGNKKDLMKVNDLAGGKFLSAGDMGFDADFSSPEFFSRFGNWAYAVLETQPADAAREFLARRPIRDEDLEPVTKLVPYPHEPAKEPKPSAHQLGQIWSRAWALRELSRSPVVSETDRARFAKAYDAHVQEGLRQLEKYGDGYMTYGHWVPQFAVYALTR